MDVPQTGLRRVLKIGMYGLTLLKCVECFFGAQGRGLNDDTLPETTIPKKVTKMRAAFDRITIVPCYLLSPLKRLGMRAFLGNARLVWRSAAEMGFGRPSRVINEQKNQSNSSSKMLLADVAGWWAKLFFFLPAQRIAQIVDLAPRLVPVTNTADPGEITFPVADSR